MSTYRDPATIYGLLTGAPGTASNPSQEHVREQKARGLGFRSIQTKKSQFQKAEPAQVVEASPPYEKYVEVHMRASVIQLSANLVFDGSAAAHEKLTDLVDELDFMINAALSTRDQLREADCSTKCSTKTL